MTKEYIERGALMEYADTQPGGLISNKSIQFFPAADVAEVKRGRWVTTTPHPHCSECFVECRDQTPHCPNCGAKMGGKGEGE